MSSNYANTDNICNTMMYKLFPNSKGALDKKIQLIEKDIDALYGELRETKSSLNELTVILKKLNNRNIPMDPNGMTRADAIKSTRSRAMLLCRKVKRIQEQITLFEGSKFTLENSQMATAMNIRIRELHRNMKNVEHMEPLDMEDKIDDIADVNDQIESLSKKMSDTMVSAWTIDMESDEAMLDELLAMSDDEEDIESLQFQKTDENTLPTLPTVSTEPIPKKTEKKAQRVPVEDLF